MILRIAKLLFLLLVVSLPLVRPFNTIIFGLQVPYTDFIFLGVFIFWLIAVVTGKTAFKFDKFYIFIGIYAFALIISTIYSTNQTRSFHKLLGEFYLFALAILTFNLARDKTFIKQIVYAWLVGTSLTILAVLTGFFMFYIGFKSQADNYFLSHFGSLPAGNYPRIHALFSNANMMCNFLNVSLMMTVLTEKTGWLKKIVARILQTGVWTAAIFTFSAGIGGMFLSLGIWYWSLFRTNNRKYLSKAAIVLTLILAFLVFCSTLASPDTANTTQEFSIPFTGRKIESSVRVLVWQNAFDKFLEYPFFGRGTGTDSAQLKYQTISGDNQVLLDAHNNWLNIAGQTGLFGAAAFLLLNLFLLTKCKFKFQKIDRSNLVLLALSCAFIGAFIYQGLSGSFEDARHLWITFGLLVAASEITSKTDTSTESAML